MEQEQIHELSAAYALDALDENERRRFEEHLEHCTVCAEELASLRSAATALAYAVEGPAPPDALRSRLLERARAERPSNVSLLSRRRVLPAVAAVAAVAASAAIAFGIWAAALSGDLDRERSASSQRAQVIAVLASADARRIPLAGQKGQLVVRPSGAAVLVVAGLPPAPDGKTYEVWVVGPGAPLPAGIFSGGRDSALALERPVPQGTRVAVSLERAGGVEKLAGPVLFGTRETV